MNVTSLIALLVSLVGQAQSEPSAREIRIAPEYIVIELMEKAFVPAREAGVLVEVDVREGDQVEEGALLARIDDAAARLESRRAEIELKIASEKAANRVDIHAAEAARDVAEAELRRALTSVELYRNSVSGEEIDRLRLAARQAALAIQQAQHKQETAELTVELKQNAHELAKLKLERRRIRAPFAGVVVEVRAHQGEHVEPGSSVFRILRLDRLWAKALVVYDALPGDLAGCPVTLSVDLPGERKARFDGRLVFVSPEINPQSKKVEVWAEIENRDLRLRPGLKGTMFIHPQDEKKPGRAGS